MAKPRDTDWEAVLGAAADLQKLIPGTALVGGTAVALHIAHRFSMDADHVLPDLIDFAALAATVGPEATQSSLVRFDDYYEDVYRPERRRDVSPALQLSRQLTAPKPADLDRTEVSTYKGIVEPWGEWSAIAAQCKIVSVLVAESLTQE